MTGIEAVGGRACPLDGLHPFDPGRDLRDVVELLQLGFHDELAARDRRWLDQLGAVADRAPALAALTRLLAPGVTGLGGFVWYVDGRLVANASLLRGPGDAWAVANVVTRSEHRRRGIARALMHAVLQEADRQGVRQLQLQVRDDNAAARSLYAALGFRRTGSRSLLRLDAAAVPHDLGAGAAVCQVIAWGIRDTPRARSLLERAGRLDGGGPPGLARQTVRAGGLAVALDDWWSGRVTRRWAAASAGAFRALAVARRADRGGAHQLEVVTDPVWRGAVEAALIGAALDDLARAPRAVIEAELDAEEAPAIALLVRGGFARVRTLELMVLEPR